MKYITLKNTTYIIVVLLLLFAVLNHGELSQTILALAVLLVLLSLFAELKEFDFWGLKGKKSIPNFKDLQGKAIGKKHAHVTTKEVFEAEKTTELPKLDTTKATFLALSFEIERLLRVYAGVMMNKDVPNTISPERLTTELADEDLLTAEGVKQLESIRWLSTILIHGRDNEVTEQTIEAGTDLAKGLYDELYSWLYEKSK